MNISSGPERDRLIKALRNAWTVEADRVARFGLRVLEDRIAPAYSGWTVPIISGVPTGSATELAQTIHRLQDLTEDASNLSITIFLDPFAKAG